jgi:hypothetical protein
MKRTVTAVGTTLGAVGLLLITSSAHAQQQTDFTQKGQFIISADRLVPFFAFTHTSTDEATGGPITKNVQTSSQSSLSFFYGYTPPGPDLFYTVPRLGVDYTIVPNVTIGGDIVVYFTLGGSSGTETDSSNGSSVTTSTSSPSTTLFGIAPRGGYILGLNNMFSLWLRGGFSFYTESRTTTTGDNADNNLAKQTNNFHQWSLDLDPQFVITPFPHIGFTAGVTMDIPFGGGHSIENVTNNTTTTFSAGASDFYLGVTLGMLVHF